MIEVILNQIWSLSCVRMHVFHARENAHFDEFSDFFILHQCAGRIFFWFLILVRSIFGFVLESLYCVHKDMNMSFISQSIANNNSQICLCTFLFSLKVKCAGPVQALRFENNLTIFAFRCFQGPIASDLHAHDPGERIGLQNFVS